MRRNDRQVTDLNEVYNFISSQNTLRLGLYGDDFPYVVPLTYGFTRSDGKFIFYIHSAMDGKKCDLIKRNSKVCVEIDCNDGFVSLKDGVTVDYTSFIGFGVAEQCEGDEKIKALDLLMKNCGYDGFPDGECNLLPVTNIYKIIVDFYTCKKRFI